MGPGRVTVYYDIIDGADPASRCKTDYRRLVVVGKAERWNDSPQVIFRPDVRDATFAHRLATEAVSD
ncbi:MAG: hypothetical protein Tp176DCM1853251_47 [Prokaryotic dsDNA virus sp.]|nr:MAG: hypothetical protein Tp176DCM1853251_47 [Prokaryotic dsDNA virus sp.]